MMHKLTENPIYGLTICVMAYAAGQWLNRRLKTPLANPLGIAIVLVIAAHHVLKVPYENFNQGGRVLSMLLPPATASLAVTIYRRREILKRALLPLLAGCFAGSLASVLCIHFLCRALGVEEVLAASMLPKSVTTPIAVSLAPPLGGNPSITTAAVIFTGMIGAVCAPLFIRIFHLRDPVAEGIAIGTSSHAVGTSRAVELGEVQGAISGISIGVAGLITTLLLLFW